MIFLRPWFLILLAIAVMATGFFAFFVPSTHDTSQIIAPQQSDGFMIDVTSTKMLKEGVPEMTLFSPKMIHYPDNDRADFTTPHMVFFNRNKQNPWNITSEDGQAFSGMDKIILTGNVKIHQDPGGYNKDTNLTTTELTVYPPKNFANTDKPVTVTQPGSVINSTGMEVYFKTGIVNLLADARGEYDPSE